MNSTFKKTALATIVAGTLAGAAIPAAQANVLVVDWQGAFTMLNPTGGSYLSSSSDYVSGAYANGDSSALSLGAPKYTANAVNGYSGPGTGYTDGHKATIHSWFGYRTPVMGTMSFDTSTGAGVGTVNDFFFFGDASGSGAGSSVARALGISFAAIDTVGTLVGTMLFSWNGGGHSVSIVLDASGMFGAMAGGAFTGGPTSTITGVGALPASNGMNFGTTTTPVLMPLGASPVATKSLNTADGCNIAGAIATQANAYTINMNMGVVGACTVGTSGMIDDSIGGSPMTSGAFGLHNANFDITSVHMQAMYMTPTEVVPVPAAVWLFGSGLLGLVGIARRKKKA